MYEEMMYELDCRDAFREKEIEEALAYMAYRKRMCRDSQRRLMIREYECCEDIQEVVPSYDW